MGSKALRLLKRLGVIVGVIAVTLLAVRAYDSQRGPPLELWHAYVPRDLVQDWDRSYILEPVGAVVLLHGLTNVDWEDRSEAARPAVREVRQRIGPSAPLHLVGFSNGRAPGGAANAAR